MRKITASRAHLSIGEISRLTGVNVETIRYYEKIKLLPTVPRTNSGRRVYGPTETPTLAFVRRARELGFSLDEVRGLLALAGPGSTSCAEVREIAARHLEHIRAKLADLKRLERLLASTIIKCTADMAPKCAVIDVLDIYPRSISGHFPSGVRHRR